MLGRLVTCWMFMQMRSHVHIQSGFHRELITTRMRQYVHIQDTGIRKRNAARLADIRLPDKRCKFMRQHVLFERIGLFERHIAYSAMIFAFVLWIRYRYMLM